MIDVNDLTEWLRDVGRANLIELRGLQSTVGVAIKGNK